MSIEKAISLCYFFLKFRPRTEVEIIRYLERKSLRFHFSNEIIHATVIQLKQGGFINDEKFVKMYVANRNLLKPRGVFLLKRELSHLGIQKNLIEEYFSQNEMDDLNTALNLLKRRESLKRLDEKTRFKKAISYLLRKGFTYDVAKKAYSTNYY